MNYARKTYIKFLYRGFSTNANPPSEVRTRDISRVRVPRNTFGFQFFDILSVVVDADGEKVQLTSERINLSPIHYFGGKWYTIEEIKRQFPNELVTIDNIKFNDYLGAIRYPDNKWVIFKTDDIFVKELSSE